MDTCGKLILENLYSWKNTVWEINIIREINNDEESEENRKQWQVIKKPATVLQKVNLGYLFDS